MVSEVPAELLKKKKKKKLQCSVSHVWLLVRQNQVRGNKALLGFAIKENSHLQFLH